MQKKKGLGGLLFVGMLFIIHFSALFDLRAPHCRRVCAADDGLWSSPVLGHVHVRSPGSLTGAPVQSAERCCHWAANCAACRMASVGVVEAVGVPAVGAGRSCPLEWPNIQVIRLDLTSALFAHQLQSSRLC